MNKEILKTTAQALVAKGKGILAADESAPTIKKRFDAVGVEDSEENRRAYREMIITTPELEKYISGIILFDETIRQASSDGAPFIKILESKGIIPGIKVDKGAKDMALHEGEKITEGLDGLRNRLIEYKELGARFAKWRAVIKIDDHIPTDACINANSCQLALYAALCQEADLVPVVEPEVLIDGDHDIEKSCKAMAKTLNSLFSKLKNQGVLLEGTILKTSMVTSGKDSANQASVEEVAHQTVRCLKENVPAELAGIVFLSGGQSDEKATLHLNEMNKLYKDLPWPLSFSYGRGIQNQGLKIWAENPQNIAAAQAAILQRSRDNALASLGEFE